MKFEQLHDWDLTPAEARALQTELAQRLEDRPLALEELRWVAGVDVSVRDDVAQAAVVVLSFPALKVVETVTARRPVTYPYIPGLLSFREGPVLLDAFAELRQTPDVLLFDGMGRIHPRRLGIAAHMGLWLELPTLGIGKKHFLGDYAPPGLAQGERSDLTYKGERLGVVLRTRARVKPVYVSAGHLLDLETAVALALACTTRYRLPEPIRQAHQAAGRG